MASETQGARGFRGRTPSDKTPALGTLRDTRTALHLGAIARGFVPATARRVRRGSLVEVYVGARGVPGTFGTVVAREDGFMLIEVAPEHADAIAQSFEAFCARARRAPAAWHSRIMRVYVLRRSGRRAFWFASGDVFRVWRKPRGRA